MQYVQDYRQKDFVVIIMIEGEEKVRSIDVQAKHFFEALDFARGIVTGLRIHGQTANIVSISYIGG